MEVPLNSVADILRQALMKYGICEQIGHFHPFGGTIFNILGNLGMFFDSFYNHCNAEKYFDFVVTLRRLKLFEEETGSIGLDFEDL